ncbi:hypothetical protein GCM10028821_15170 [Hymenobacter jeollabukensis]
MAQVVVPAGNPNSFVSRYPFGTYYGYERSAMIYTAGEIGSSGNITQIGFYTASVSTPGNAPTKIYIKTTTASSFAAATTVAAEEAGATLVYDATIPASSFTANSWVNVPLTTPFAYNGTSNLEVIVETNATGAGNEDATSKRFRMTELGVNRFQIWATDNAAPTTAGTLATPRPNIQLTGLTAPNCAGPTAPVVSGITTTAASVAFTPATGATNYTVTYTPQGGTATTVTPAPTASPISLSGLTPGTAYTVTIASNCAGSTTSQQTTIGFTTLANAPANDNCAGAVLLTAAATCTTTNGTVSGATQSQAPSTCSQATSSTALDVWYRFVATGTSHVVTVAGGFDGVLEGFSGACGTLTSLGCIDAIGNGETLTLTGLTSGSTYYVRYYAFEDSSLPQPTNGAFTICVTNPATSTGPANDNPTGAIALTIGATCTPVNGTNTGATTTTVNGYVNGTNPNTACGIAVSPKDVWYKFTTAASGAGSTAVRIQVTGAPAGYLRLFSSPGGAATGPFTEIACASGRANNTVSEPLVAYGLTPNTTYYVFVAGFGSTDTQGAFTICATSLPDNDAAVQAIYTLGKTPAGSPVTVQAVIRNAGGSPISSVPVSLTVAGVTTFTNAQLTGTIAPGTAATVTFTAYTPATAGNNTITVSLLADDVASNNTLTFAQVVTTNVLSYANNTAFDPQLSVGFGITSTAAFVARFTTAEARTLTAVTAGLGGVASGGVNPTVGNTVYGVAYSSTGALLGRTPNYVVTTADIGTRKTFTFATPISLAAGTTFHVGMVQTPPVDAATRYFPMATLPQSPTQPGTFFTVAAAGGTLTDAAASNLGIFVIEALADRVTGTSAALNRAISLYPNPSTNGEVTLSVQNAKAQNGLEVQIINTLGQTVYTKGQLRDNFENKLNLSHLAAGMYTLKVKSGDEYTIRQLSLTK